MMDFLQDKEFLHQVNQYHIRSYRAAIRVLDFETERPLAILQGKIAGGNLSVAANSSVRRTGNLSFIADNDTIKISDINNLIAINKKISLSIGFDNPLYSDSLYQKYGKILWFKQGTFFITSASSSFSASSKSISISFVDKMGGLNGTCGGIIPASTSFHDEIDIDAEGNETTKYPLIKNIIRECVHHFGHEHYSKIIVEDVDDYGRIQVNYNGETPIRFTASYYNDSTNNLGSSFIIDENNNDNFPRVFYQGDPIGYMETDLTYPGELILGAGSTVDTLLSEIVKTLGNFEYFYDVDGNFHFRRIKDFQMTGNTPLNWSITDNKDKELWQSYLPRYTNRQYIDEFADASLVTQVSFSPKYDNIKNDFVVWGTLNDSGNTNSNTAVRYHLAIDKRPEDIAPPAAGSQAVYTIGDNYSLCYKTIWRITKEETGEVLRYQTNSTVNEGEVADIFCKPLSEYNYENDDHSEIAQRAIPSFNWREELYRQALMAWGASTTGTYYDEELLAEWRDVFDPNNNSFAAGWNTHHNDFGDWTGYNPDILLAPHKIRYWLDIIDSNSYIGQFSVQQIGRRSKVTENSKIKSVFPTEVPDIVFTVNDNNVPEKVQYYISIGQDFAFINADQEQLFKKVNSYGTCYDDIRSLLMTNLIYNSQVNLTTIPIFYLDINEILHLNFSDMGISGDYVIKNISWSLGGNMNSMSLTLNEANIII